MKPWVISIGEDFQAARSAGFTRCAGITNPSPNTKCHIWPIANGHKVTKTKQNKNSLASDEDM